jgi:hypothetical protein
MEEPLSQAQHWQKLCEEHEVARAAYFAAFGAVNAKFAAIGAGVSATNPTLDELSAFESTWKAWQDVKDRMNSFVKANA